MNDVNVLTQENQDVLDDEQAIEKIMDLIRATLDVSASETEAIGTINQKVDGATVKGCRPNKSGSLTFLVEIEISSHTQKISVTRKFH